MKAHEFITEAWSQKYKSSINCSHPKGFSQKAHCAGKKKHNESIEMEMVCEMCGMCQTYGDHSRANLNEKCWDRYKQVGMKNKGGRMVPDCRLKESVTEDDDAVASFVARGGEIQQIKPQRGPKRSGMSLASKHIGSGSGRGTTKGKVSGLGANTGKSGKPVVTAEQGVAEAAKWRDPKYQGKTFDYDDSYEGPHDTKAGKVSLDRAGMRQIDTFDPLEYKARKKQATGKLTPQDVKYATAKNFEKEKQQQLDYDRSRKAEQGVAEGICSLEEAHAIFDDFEQAMAERGLNEDAFDTITDEQIIRETAAWRRSAGKSKKGGLNAKGVASYRRENPGSKLQMAVTTKPSKLKPGSKAAKRRKSFCARMSGVQGPMKKPNGKPTRKALALRKWNC